MNGLSVGRYRRYPLLIGRKMMFIAMNNELDANGYLKKVRLVENARELLLERNLCDL